MKSKLWQSAKSWIKNIKLVTIFKDYLLTFTVQKLRAICAGINQKYGLVITKGNFGKTYSYMRKHELISVILKVKEYLANLTVENVSTRYITKRIAEIVSDDGCCNYIMHFANKHNAWKFYYWIKSKCSICLIKEQARYYNNGSEVYVIDIEPRILESIINKELKECEDSVRDSETFKGYLKILNDSPETFSKLHPIIQERIRKFVNDREKEFSLSDPQEPLEGF